VNPQLAPPSTKSSSISFRSELPIKRYGCAVQSGNGNAVAVGDLTPVEASELCELIEAYIKALVARNFAERLTRLERTTNR
jgi:hypothetical protein